MNRLFDGEYAEVYAGGASVALSLLYGEYVRRIHMNDLDRGVYAFWVAARDHADQLCRLITRAPINIREWEKQRAVQDQRDPDPLELALSTFYLNRTNRSGIITGGVIGGRQQSGVWKLGARFNKQDLVRRIRQFGRNRSRIVLHNLDGAEFLRQVAPALPPRTLLYLDPPYQSRAGRDLYANFYTLSDHTAVAELLAAESHPWVVSYDDTPEIRELYAGHRSLAYDIGYSAQHRYRGREVAFFSPSLVVPDVENPVRLSAGAGSALRLPVS